MRIDHDRQWRVSPRVPPERGQENGLRNSNETRLLLTASRAEMKQHGMRQVSHDTEVGKVTADHRVLDVRRPIWSLGSMMDSGCDVHFTKDRCWISKDDGTELDMIRSGGVQKRRSKTSSREAGKHPGTQSDDSSRSRASGHGDGERAVRIKVPTSNETPSVEESTA